MRPTLSSTISVLSLSLLTLLSACGGGGGGDKLTPEPPVGTLTFTGASAGTYVVSPPATVTGTTTIRVALAGTPTFTITFEYDSTGSTIDGMDLVVGNSSGAPNYGCSGSACNGMALDKTARTLKFTNSNLPGPSSTSTTVNGTVSW
ncbi:MAG: hypothetical protein ACOZE7_00510 [Pseudomonadota bacterium]|jgi:hypothetical protein